MPIEAWFTDWITVAPFVSADDYNRVTYGPKVRVRCRIERRQRLVRAFDGTERISDVAIATSRHMNPRDRVWLEDDDTNEIDKSREIIGKTDGKRRDGSAGHSEIFL